MAQVSSQDTATQTKAQERRAFLFLAVFLAPAIAVAIVGGYGFLVWIMQMIFGPPTG